MSAMPSLRDATDVRVFVADTADTRAQPDQIQQTLAWMTQDERVRFDRFRHDDDRQMFAVAD